MTFLWTRDGRDVTEQSTSTGDTSILTIKKIRRKNSGSYVCGVSSGSLSVMSNNATVIVFSKFYTLSFSNVGIILFYVQMNQ